MHLYFPESNVIESHEATRSSDQQPPTSRKRSLADAKLSKKAKVRGRPNCKQAFTRRKKKIISAKLPTPFHEKKEDEKKRIMIDSILRDASSFESKKVKIDNLKSGGF